jgi:hypothetical protein
VTMSLPPDLPTRKEMQRLAWRACQAAKHSPDELARHLTALAGSAASVEGILAEVAEVADAGTLRRYKDALEGDPEWAFDWLEQKFTVHPEGGEQILLCEFGQQFLVRGEPGRPAYRPPEKTHQGAAFTLVEGHTIATGRYRLRCGGRVHYDSDRLKLRATAQAYLDGFNGQLSDDLKDQILDIIDP